MKVFKFGGASVNSASAVRNMASIVEKHLDADPLVVVVSAMGKTTNLLEEIVANPSPTLLQQLKDYHFQIALDLLPNDEDIIEKINALLPAQIEGEYNFRYDQIVSHGELISTTIIAHYLNHHGISTQWVDARELIITNSRFRDAAIDWPRTQANVNAYFDGRQKTTKVFLTQGFIGGTPDGYTTTLGREGSDYSAAILAHCLEAESVTIWKDVPGFLNADPKFFSDTVKLNHLPYNEAIELSYYGASVIHPKTVKPLQNKGIPLFVRSFVTPDAEGSAIGNYHTISPETPLYIFRNNQILLSIMPRDFSFIAEDNLQLIFAMLSEVGIRVNLMQNSALSFSICVDNHPQLIPSLIERLRRLFRVRYNENLQLITIRYYNQAVIDRTVASQPILLEQRSRLTAQVVVPSNCA